MTTENFLFYLQNRLIQTSQTGGQWYSDTSPFSIPCSHVDSHHLVVVPQSLQKIHIIALVFFAYIVAGRNLTTCAIMGHLHWRSLCTKPSATVTHFSYQGTLKGKYRCTVDLPFDWFGISCMTTDNFCFNLQNRLIQTGQTGGQRYSDTSPFSIPCSHYGTCLGYFGWHDM